VSWNYRLVRYEVDDGLGSAETVYAVHEVYYDKAGRPDSLTENPSWPQASNWPAFLRDAAAYQKAWLCPQSHILRWPEDFGGAE
jgi:hypothetical protein